MCKEFRVRGQAEDNKELVGNGRMTEMHGNSIPIVFNSR